ncbi:hypothetical protein SAMN05660841_01054 [Sphingobacterium nematocida]|uniref:Uncharacterized protein n=2 Tax=Sphingobacterium nematocida TaxID=1513896 RepID=A0A1T5C1S8_9SPHI|nr:hypothetical protein SAMN05660841_01054 [Sphingobacterium nematocida]
MAPIEILKLKTDNFKAQILQNISKSIYMHAKTRQILTVILFILPSFLFSQQKYFIYKYNANFGLTSLDGTELIEGSFISHSDQIKDYALFKNKSEKQVLVHLETGKKDVFDEFDGNSIFLENQYFANVENQGQYFLWSQKTGEKLPVPKVLQKQAFQDVYMINKDYLYAVSQELVYPPAPKPKAKTATKSKVPVISPPEISKPPKNVTYVYIFKNERSMPVVAKIEVDDEKLFGNNSPNSLFDFYNLTKSPKEGKTDDSNVYLVEQRSWNPELKPWHFYYDATFNIACINILDNILIMDGNFKVLKTIARKDRDERDAVKEYFESQYPDYDVKLSYADFSPSVSMGGSARKPFWMVQNKENQYEISYLKDDHYIPFVRLEASEAKMGYDDNLYLKDAQDNELMLQLNKKTLALPVPSAYKQQFKIQLL